MSEKEPNIPHPPIVSREEWLAERAALLQEEKELTKAYDRLAAKRRRLPMVKLEKDYQFDGPNGKMPLAELFGDARQLIVYHFMFHPDWEEGCLGCTGFVDAIGDLSSLDTRDATFALISRAPLAKLNAWKSKQHGWNNNISWYSSFGSDFNYDFNVSDDKGEGTGVSVFFRLPKLDGSGDDIFHTYTTYSRGVENLVHSYALLDITPYGRQESFEDSPEGWPQKPTYG
jgi:predicted dithiol-disulfide oxidoreductase (DUF899 family)